MRLPASCVAIARQRALARARAQGCVTAANARRVDAEGVGRGARATRVVPSAPSGNGAASRVAPRSSSARAVSARNGCASRNEVSGPTGGSAVGAARRKEAHRSDAELVEQPRELILDDVGQRADDEQRVGPRSVRVGGSAGTSEARQASSPCVKVVSMPLPE